MPAKCHVAGCMTILLGSWLGAAGTTHAQQPQFPVPHSQSRPAAPEQQPAAPPATVPTQVTKLVVFSIPFEPPVTRYPRAVEVQLYVSDDAGQNWRQHSQAEPGRGKFTFRAPRDGEYWFAVRTRDEADKLHPPGRATPEMRVIVDTVSPQVSLNAWRGTAGEVRVRWQIHEPLLRPDSLKLAYGVPATDAWQSVAINPLDLRNHTTAHTGEAVFWPAAGTEALAIRATVTDAAGNVGQAEAAISAGDDAPAPLATGSAITPPGAVAEGAPSGAVPQTALRPETAAQTPPAGTPWRAAETTGGQPQPQSVPAGSAEASPAPAAEMLAESQPAAPPASAPEATHTVQQPAPTAPPETVASAPNPAVANQVTPEVAPTTDEAASSLFAMLPPGERPRMVNSNRFELEYDLESIGQQDVARVELWGTANGGETWGLCSETPGYQSPLVVQVAGAGLYGFRIVLIDHAGNGAGRPTTGDQPDVWVAVDLQPPQLQLLGVELVPDAPDSLRITWQARDEQLPAKPVSISFATSPEGPWSPLATGLPNDGQYLWELEQRTPGQVYVRVEVQDAAGNQATAISPEPIRTAAARPSGRVLNVRPVPQQ